MARFETWDQRIRREDAQEAQAGRAITLHQASNAVEALAGNDQPGFIHTLETHDETELDALQAIINGELQDRQRRNIKRRTSSLINHRPF